MDWTDDLNSSFYVNSLDLLKNPCHLYGTTNFGSSGRARGMAFSACEIRT